MPIKPSMQSSAAYRCSRAVEQLPREAWAERLAGAANRLVADRLLLAEDADGLIAAARESWDVYGVL